MSDSGKLVRNISNELAYSRELEELFLAIQDRFEEKDAEVLEEPDRRRVLFNIGVDPDVWQEWVEEDDA